MNIDPKILFLLCLPLFFAQMSMAQSSYRLGALPAVNFNTKIKKTWSLNLKVEFRQVFSEGSFRDGREQGYEYVLTDHTLIGSKKIGLNSRISGGYLFRYEQGTVIHRSIQQFALTQRLPAFRLSHRVVTDQTFAPDEVVQFRLRYRLASELPLAGNAADQQEFYLKISNEYLGILQGPEGDLEIRLIPMLGYILGERQKIELGMDYRARSFIEGNANHTFWTSVNWYIEL